MSDVSAAFELRKKYNVFRILVIGRANAGKTTLLKRVCNTDEDPCIYEDSAQKKNNLINPTEERGAHDINRSFVFRSNPEFVFHDSPGFESGSEDELNQVLTFIENRSKATEPDDQLHVIWFCLALHNKARLLLELEKKFFNEKRAGNVPVIAIYTKFDDLITQVYSDNKDKGFVAARSQAELWLAEKLKDPLFSYKYPPKSDVCLEEMDDDEGNHQEQVKVLMDKTADSLDNLAIKMLFVSVQKNNLELCIKYAIDYGIPVDETMDALVALCLIWFRHSFHENYSYESTEGAAAGRHYARRRRARRRLHAACAAAARAAARHVAARHITNFLTSRKQEPSLLTLTVCLICCNDSFWIQSDSGSDQVSFANAFQQAFDSMRKDVFCAVQNAIERLGPVPRHEDESAMRTFKSKLTKVVIENCRSTPFQN